MKFSAVDLFAGCGGLSEGFRQAGFEIVSQVEMDRFACETLKTRHLYYLLKNEERMDVYFRFLKEEMDRDEIFKLYPSLSALKEEIEKRVTQLEIKDEVIGRVVSRTRSSAKQMGINRINVVLGGPPCQPYSLIGRARDLNKKKDDGRHFLYRHYLKIIEFLKPDFFVYENVPGLISAKNHNRKIFEALEEDFSSLNPAYEVLRDFRGDNNYLLLNSADFGVPQVRKRIFLIGCQKRILKKAPEIKKLYFDFVKQALHNRQKNGYLSVNDAIGDLPPLKTGEGSDEWFGPYNTEVENGYQELMREDSPGVLNHRSRTHMKEDLERYRFFLRESKENGNANLITLKEKRPDLLPRHRNLEHFLDRFKVQEGEKPASTITAHLSKDGHYYIHPDIEQCRSFTAREAARCQSFMDNYKFEGSRTQQYIQIGNAVPPILAKAIAENLKKLLEGFYDGKN